jgi:hypothetical protein
MRIRKQVDRLTVEDLDRFPVWEYALDEAGTEGQDETTVRPYHFSPPLDPRKHGLLVRTDFELADGTRMIGTIDCPYGKGASVSDTGPVIITKQGPVLFWLGVVLRLNPEIIPKYYRWLGKDASQVFPLKFKSAIEILGGPIKGSLDGFAGIKEEGPSLFTPDFEIEIVK